MTDQELITELEGLRNTMIAVATGGPRIADVNEQYQHVFAAVEQNSRDGTSTIR